MKLILLYFLVFSTSVMAEINAELSTRVASGIAAEVEFSKYQTSKILVKNVKSSIKKELGAEFENFNTKEKLTLKKAMLERLIERQLLLYMAKKLNLMPSTESVEKLFGTINKKLENKSSLDKELSKKGVLRKDFKSKFRDCLLYTSPSPRD